MKAMERRRIFFVSRYGQNGTSLTERRRTDGQGTKCPNRGEFEATVEKRKSVPLVFSHFASGTRLRAAGLKMGSRGKPTFERAVLSGDAAIENTNEPGDLEKRTLNRRPRRKRREGKSAAAKEQFGIPSHWAVQQVCVSHADKVKCNALDSVGTANETSFLKVELSGICGITGVFGRMKNSRPNLDREFRV
jgi:hypothetical protein